MTTLSNKRREGWHGRLLSFPDIYLQTMSIHFAPKKKKKNRFLISLHLLYSCKRNHCRVTWRKVWTRFHLIDFTKYSQWTPAEKPGKRLSHFSVAKRVNYWVNSTVWIVKPLSHLHQYHCILARRREAFQTKQVQHVNNEKRKPSNEEKDGHQEKSKRSFSFLSQALPIRSLLKRSALY